MTKSGTNTLHGSMFEYNRNSKTTANDFFSAKAGLHDQLIRNQFAGSLGGPIKKDKVCMFGAIEFQRLRTSPPFTTTGVTQQFIDFTNSGGLAAFLNANAGTTFNCTKPSTPGCTLGPIFKQLHSAYSLPRATTQLSNLQNSSIVLPTLTYPVPIFGQVSFLQSTSLNEVRPDLRFDYNLDSRNVLAVHYALDDYPNTTAGTGGGFANPAFPISDIARAQSAGVTWTHTISPTMVNEAKMDYLRSHAGFPCYFCNVPSIGTAANLGLGFGTTGSLPQFFTENTFQWLDNFSTTHGRHTFKLGGEYRRTRNGSAFEAESNGFFQMWDTENLLTDGAVGDNLGAGMNYVAEASVNPASPTPAFPQFYRGFRANEFGFYAEDQFKASGRVTATLGLRWDYFGPPHNYQPGIDSDLDFGSPNFNQCVIKKSTGKGLCYPGDPTPGTLALPSNNPYFPINPYTASAFSAQFQLKPNEIWNKDTGDFAPRVGLAWDVFGNQKTVLRMGGGFFYDRIYNNVFENIRFNPPFFAFAEAGLFFSGTTQGPVPTPGFYSTPISVANFAPYAVTPSARQMDPNLRSAYDEQVNFDIQHQLGANWLLDTAYIGTFGHRLLGLVDISTFDGRTVGHGYSTARIVHNLGSDNMRGNWFNSNYHSLQVSLSKRFSHGLQFNTNYT